MSESESVRELDCAKAVGSEELGFLQDFPILIAGVITSLLTLVVVYFLNKTEFYVMGLFLWFIVPIGALCVGALSGSGYCIMQWRLSVRASWWLLLSIAVISVLAYFSAHYVTYLEILGAHEDAQGMKFSDYLRLIAEGYSFKSDDGGELAMGKWGYLAVAAEIVGFTLGSLIPSLALRAKPYCGRCRKYLRAHKKYIVAGRSETAFKKRKRKERKAIIAEAVPEMEEEARKLMDELRGLGRDEALALLEERDRGKDKERMAEAWAALSMCPDCDTFYVNVSIWNTAIDGSRSFTGIGEVDSRESEAKD